MENRGLLFIPDISGFTRFVHESELEHSRLVIQELLELLLNANELGLEVSEIEGDAILFYKFGPPADLGALYRQVETMFCQFHRTILAYTQRRYCHCQACLSVGKLTLKVITHYGEFTGYNVKSFTKLIGKDLITAHQLLKNDIDNHEYWLVTNPLLLHSAEVSAFEGKWYEGSKQTETGEVRFKYMPLGNLKHHLHLEPELEFDPDNHTQVASVTCQFDTDIITLFHASGYFQYRTQWFEGVTRVEPMGHYLPRVGMRCQWTRDKRETILYATSCDFGWDRIQFSETEEQSQVCLYYTLEKISNTKTQFTLEYYLPKQWGPKLYYTIFQKRKTQRRLQQSLHNLAELVKGLAVPKAS
jgi:hypothetical protein